jgi:hypothetical protein
MFRIGRIVWLTAVLPMAPGTAAETAEAATIYSVNRSVGALTLTGQVVTDGTIGGLGSGNFVDWNLTIDTGAFGFGTDTLLGPLSGANSQLETFGSSLAATADSLVFDFSGLGVVRFIRSTLSGHSYWCLDNVLQACDPASGETIGWRSTVEFFAPRTGIQTIATLQTTAIPEPSSVVLLATGALGFLGRARRRRRRASEGNAAAGALRNPISRTG